jgi:hypothetical protein
VVFALNMMGAAVDKETQLSELSAQRFCTKKEAFLIAMMISLLIMIHAP